MRKLWQAHRLSALAVLVAGAALSLAAQGLVAAATASSAGTPGAAASAVRPRAVGGLDCNGLSPIQRPAQARHDVRRPAWHDGGRFVENGHYIGHDEPSFRFLSNLKGSGRNI